MDFQALGPTALSSQGKHIHMHTHTHAHTQTHTCTHTHMHIHTHAHQVGIFIRKPERSTSEFMIYFKS